MHSTPLRRCRAASEGMSAEGELGLLYFVVPVAPGRSRLFSLPLATNAKFRWGGPRCRGSRLGHAGARFQHQR